MKTMFKQTFLLTGEEKKQVGEMCGKIVLWILEGQSTGYMAENLKMHPRQVNDNICELLYILKKQVGIKRFIKALFRN